MPSPASDTDANRRQALARGSAVVDAVAATLPVTTAWLFGSGAVGRLRADSDLDLGLLFAQRVDPAALAALAAELEALAGRTVQLVDLVRAGPIIGRQVLAHGVLLRDAAPARRHAFTMRILTDYADLKAARAPAELALRERFSRVA